MRDAQASGRPGAPGGTPLRRLVNPDLQERNGRTACPGRYTRPSGKSCDEYPFASTREGAFNSYAGTDLGSFYADNRMLHDDAFYVQTTS